jgi:hypothetical protein
MDANAALKTGSFDTFLGQGFLFYREGKSVDLTAEGAGRFDSKTTPSTAEF